MATTYDIIYVMKSSLTQRGLTALAASNGNTSKAAKASSIPRSTLRSIKLREEVRALRERVEYLKKLVEVLGGEV